MGHARPRSYRHAGWSDDGADGGDVVVRAEARAVAEFGQRRRRRGPGRPNIDPGSGPATSADGAALGAGDVLRPQAPLVPAARTPLVARSRTSIVSSCQSCRTSAGPFQRGINNETQNGTGGSPDDRRGAGTRQNSRTQWAGEAMDGRKSPQQGRPVFQWSHCGCRAIETSASPLEHHRDVWAD